MSKGFLKTVIIAAIVSMSGELLAQTKPVLYLPFDDIRVERRKMELERGETYVPQEVFAYVTESVTGEEFELKGKYYKSVNGVTGKAALLDGYTAHMEIGLPWPDDEEEAETYVSPMEVEEDFTIEVWVALGAYPKSASSILSHRRDETFGRNEGYSFEIDAWGRPLVKVGTMDGKTETLVADERVELNQWYHLAASHSGTDGLSIYVNGKQVANRTYTGKYNALKDAGDFSLLIGKSRVPIRPTGTIRGYGTEASFTYIDGILDELKLYKSALSAKEIAQNFKDNSPEAAPDLPERKLPSGPKSPGIFRAVNTTLKYYPGWDAPWAVDKNADIVVQFDESDCKFVFWRGTGYIPSWVTENDIHFNNGFNEGWNDHGSCEPMSDKKTKYSSVKIVESNKARVVVLWRYALVDVLGTFAFEDPETGWGDWTNETYYIYPDMTAVREDKLLSNAPHAAHEWQESMMVLGPGQRPEDVLEMGGLTVSNINGQKKTYSWEHSVPPWLPQEPKEITNQIVNTKSSYRPFSCIRPQDIDYMDIYAGEIRRDVSVYPWWNHWPVAPRPTDGRWANFADRAAHASLSHWYWNEYKSDDRSMTKIMLNGMTNGNIDDITRLNQSWSNPAQIVAVSGANDAHYRQEEKAYHLTVESGANAVTFEVLGKKESPILNPAFVVNNWGDRTAKIKINGEQVAQSKDVRFDTRDSIEGRDLVLWIRHDSEEKLKIEISGE